MAKEMVKLRQQQEPSVLTRRQKWYFKIVLKSSRASASLFMESRRWICFLHTIVRYRSCNLTLQICTIITLLRFPKWLKIHTGAIHHYIRRCLYDRPDNECVTILPHIAAAMTRATLRLLIADFIFPLWKLTRRLRGCLKQY